MSKKIVLTVEQEEAINNALKAFGGSKERVINVHAKDREWGQFQELNEFDVSQMARILYEPNSYEVESKFWSELGREVGEFKVGDVRIGHGGLSIVVHDKESATKHYKKGNIKGFYPAESFIKLP